MFRSLAAALICALLPLGALAQESDICAFYMTSRQIPQPPAGLSDAVAMQIVGQALLPFTFDTSLLSEEMAMSPPDLPHGACSPQQLAMLTANLAAIASAVPVSDPQALYGTWISDDILAMEAGFILPGQEVLVIAPDAAGATDAIAFRQYWYRSIASGGGSIWDADGSYAGLVAQGVLRSTGDGDFMQDRMGAPIDYTGTELSDERVEDLFIKGRLNVFDQAVGFSMDGDALVLRYDSRMPIYRLGTPATRSYRRVAPGAPEMAMAMVRSFGISQMKYFNCLTRKISAQDPALSEMLKPLSLDEVRDLTREAAMLESANRTMIRELRRTGGDDAARDRLRALIEKEAAVQDRLKPASVVFLSTEGTVLCPEPPPLF